MRSLVVVLVLVVGCGKPDPPDPDVSGQYRIIYAERAGDRMDVKVKAVAGGRVYYIRTPVVPDPLPQKGEVWDMQLKDGNYNFVERCDK